MVILFILIILLMVILLATIVKYLDYFVNFSSERFTVPHGLFNSKCTSLTLCTYNSIMRLWKN